MNRTKEYPPSDGLPGFTLTYKKCRRIIMRISPEGRLLVSAPDRTPMHEIRAAVTKHLGWIEQTADKARERVSRRPEAVDGGSFMLGGELYPLRISAGSRSSCELSGGEVRLVVTDPGDAELIARRLDAFLRDNAERLFRESFERTYPLVCPLGAPTPELKIRRMTSRWGSCNTSEYIITLNLCLARAPARLIDHVMLHELIHLLNRPHDARFYQIFDSLMPDHAERKKELESLCIIY